MLTDSKRCAKIVPLPSYTFRDSNGILIGENLRTKEPAFYDPANLDVVASGSTAIFAPTGGGKSTLIKLSIIRMFLTGRKILIIDNTGEYSSRLALELGMKIFRLGKNGSKINPFSPFVKDTDITEHIKDSLIPLFAILLKDAEFNSAFLDKIFHDFYKSKGTKNMETFVRFLKKYQDRKSVEQEQKVIIRKYVTELERYTKYSLKNVFGDTNDFNNLHKFQGIVFDVSELSNSGAEGEKHLTAIMHIIVTNLWLMAKNDHTPRFLFIDEAHHFLNFPETAHALAIILKEGRKYGIFTTISTQDADDFFNSRMGLILLANTYTQVYGKILVNEKNYNALGINEQIYGNISHLDRFEFRLQRGKENMYFKTQFLSDYEKKICDTTDTNFLKTMKEIEVKKDGKN